MRSALATLATLVVVAACSRTEDSPPAQRIVSLAPSITELLRDDALDHRG